MHIPVACTTQETVECPRNKCVTRTYGAVEAYHLVSTISLDLVATNSSSGGFGGQQDQSLFGLAKKVIRVEKGIFLVLDNLESYIRRWLNLKDFAAWDWHGTGSTSAPGAQEKGSGRRMLSGPGRKHLTCKLDVTSDGHDSGQPS